jgi:hypothetical protein
MKLNCKRNKEIKQINSDNGKLVILNNMTKTASFQLEAMARFYWLWGAPNTFSNQEMELEDQNAYSSCSSSRTSSEFPDFGQEHFLTKCNKLIVIRTVFQQGLKICKRFLLILNIATWSSERNFLGQSSNHNISLYTQPNRKL